MTTCPKCKTECNDHIAIDFCYCPNPDCGFQGTISQQQRIEFLEGLLRQIEEHPHCREDQVHQVHWYNDGQWRMGYSQGHRCAADIAVKWKTQTR